MTSFRFKKTVSLPANYKFRFTKIFGNAPKIKIIEFFIAILIKFENEIPPWTYISQIAKYLKLSKSSVKRVVDQLLEQNFLIEKKIETHVKNPRRDIRLNTKMPYIEALIRFYKDL